MSDDQIQNSETIRILVYREEKGFLVAQCLEHDIAVQARDLKTLRHRFMRTFLGYLAIAKELGDEAFSKLEPTPEYFRVAWINASDKFVDPIELDHNQPAKQAELAMAY